jgi:hypothetical protein
MSREMLIERQEEVNLADLLFQLTAPLLRSLDGFLAGDFGHDRISD